MVNYLANHLDGLTEMCEPLRRLNKEKIASTWTHEQELAFQRTTDALVKAPVHVFFDEQLSTTLQCGTSQSSLGAVLMLEGHPVA